MGGDVFSTNYSRMIQNNIYPLLQLTHFELGLLKIQLMM